MPDEDVEVWLDRIQEACLDHLQSAIGGRLKPSFSVRNPYYFPRLTHQEHSALMRHIRDLAPCDDASRTAYNKAAGRVRAVASAADAPHAYRAPGPARPAPPMATGVSAGLFDCGPELGGNIETGEV